MRDLVLWCLLLGLGLTVPGCTFQSPVKTGADVSVVSSGSDRVTRAYEAGSLAASAYLLTKAPAKEQVAALHVVTAQLKTQIGTWPENGFIGLNSQVALLLQNALAKDTNPSHLPAAIALSNTLLSELDKLFDKHPDWKVKGGSITDVLAAFVSGVDDTFEIYSR